MSSPLRASVVRGDLPADLAFADARRVAWDIETSGLDWRRNRLGTCQLYADGAGSVIVTTIEDRPRRLMDLIENPVVEKIFHHAPFDLRFMAHSWGVQPRSIRCTKVASKLLEPNAANEDHSLQSLLRRYLKVEVQKGSVRTSNWLAPILTQEQVDYAVGDVIHLPELLSALETALRSAGLADLYDACCAFLPGRVQLELGGYPDVFAY